MIEAFSNFPRGLKITQLFHVVLGRELRRCALEFQDRMRFLALVPIA